MVESNKLLSKYAGHGVVISALCGPFPLVRNAESPYDLMQQNSEIIRTALFFRGPYQYLHAHDEPLCTAPFSLTITWSPVFWFNRFMCGVAWYAWVIIIEKVTNRRTSKSGKLQSVLVTCCQLPIASYLLPITRYP